MTRPYEGHYLTEERKKIAEENINFIWYYYKKFVSSKHKLNSTEKDDVIEALYWGLCLAAEAWDPEKGKFSTICQWYFRSAVNDYFRRRKLFYGRYTLIPFIFDENVNGDFNNTTENFTIIKKQGTPEELDKKEKITWDDISCLFEDIDLEPNEDEVLLYHFKYGYNLKEVGNLMGLTGERVRQIKECIIEKAKEYVDLMGLEFEDFVQ